MKKILKKITKSHFLIYTIICGVAMLLVFKPFIENKLSFIWLPDTTSQHFTSFVYYGKFLREIAKNLLAGRLVIPQYNFSMGFGEDILNTLHYYVIGDPLNLISAVIPSKYAVYGYTLLMVFRYYLAGLAFMALAKYKKLPALSSTCGAVLYLFSTYSLYMAIRHPSFLNPFIYFPLIILGIEMIFDKKRPYLFILSICLSALSSFYFFYVLSLFTVLYIFVRLFFEYKNQFFKNLFISFVKFGGSYLLGVLMAGIVFVPVVVSFLSSSRGSVDYGLNLFYHYNYYEYFLAAFVSHITLENSSIMGFTALGLAGVILLFMRKKENSFLKTAFIILTVMMMFPVVSKITNGFSYVTNRWSFVYGLLVSFVFAVVIKDIKRISIKESLVLCSASVLFEIYVFALNSRIDIDIWLPCIILLVFSMMCLAYSLFVYIKKINNKRNVIIIFKTVVMLLTVFAVGANSFYIYDTSKGTILPSFRSNELATKFAYSNGFKKLRNYQDTENAVERYEDIAGELGETNNALINDTYTNKEYYSLVNSNVNNFQNEMGLVNQNYSIVNDTAGDPYINTIENIKYIVRDGMNSTFYGVNSEPLDYLRSNLKEKKNPKKGIYVNSNYVPFGYTYENVISAEDYNALSSTEKRAVLVNAVVLNDTDEYVNSASADFDVNDVKFDYTIEGGENVKVDGNRVYSKKDDTTITIKAKVEQTGQLYCVFNDVKFTPANATQLALAVDGEILPEKAEELEKRDKLWRAPTCSWLVANGNTRGVSFNITTPFYDYYTAVDDFTVNLGYCEKGETEITLTFKAGIYDFGSIDIISKDMTDFEENISELQKDTLDDLKIETDKISGRINLDESKILYLSVPYSEYWTAVVDGEEAEILKANTAFMALPLDAGEHTVELKYRNTSIDKSAFISFGGFIIFAGVVIVYESLKKKNKN